MIDVILLICTIAQTFLLGCVAYMTWAGAYSKVLPFHKLKWQTEFIKERKRQGMK